MTTMARKIAKTKGERTGVFGDEVAVTLVLPGRTAWGLGVLSRIQGVSLGKLCRKALGTLLENQGIPWSKYDAIRASLESGSPRMEGQGATENPDAPVAEFAGDIPPALASPPAGESGGPRPKRPLDEILAEVKPTGRRKAS
jgi:hypothetical protein